MSSGRNTELGRRVCLALADEGVEHGWTMVKLLAPDGELGRIWSLSRPLTYRAISTLVDDALLARAGPVAGRGPDRQPVRVTRAGSRSNADWLGRPVDHVRDFRTELLLKLELRRRRRWGLHELVAAQLDHIEPTLRSMLAAREPDIVGRWRREQARAARRFLEKLLADDR